MPNNKSRIATVTGKPISSTAIIDCIELIESIPAPARSIRQKKLLKSLTKYGDTISNQRHALRSLPILKKIIKNAFSDSQIVNVENFIENQELTTKLPDVSISLKLKVFVDTLFENYDIKKASDISGLSVKDFYENIDKPEHKDVARSFIKARAAAADEYLRRREFLERELLDGNLDTKTYKVLTDSYFWLAERMFPELYGTRLKVEQNNTDTVIHELQPEAVKQFNRLLTDDES